MKNNTHELCDVKMENSHVLLGLLSGADGGGNICWCQTEHTHAGLEGCEGMSERERMRKACKRQQPTTVAALCMCVCAYLSLCTCLLECVWAYVVRVCGRQLCCGVCVLRLRCCAQQTGWWNNGCHLSAWEGSVMDCIRVEVVDWQHSKTKDINSTLTAQKTTTPALPNRAQRAILILMEYSGFHKTAFLKSLLSKKERTF